MEQLINRYNLKIEELLKEISEKKKNTNSIFYARTILFLSAFIAFFILVKDHPVIAIILIPVLIIIFLFLLNLEIRISRQTTFLKNLIKVNQIEIDLLNNNYEKFNEGSEFLNKHHNFISDLDIFGKRSIFQLLNRTSTYSGRIRLASWLTSPFLNKEEIIDRQNAIKELSGKIDWNQKFIALGFINEEAHSDKDVIKDWLEEPLIFSSAVLKFLGYILPVLTSGAGILYLSDLLPSGYFTFLFFTQLILIGSYTKRVSNIHDRLSRKFDSIEKYRTLLSHIESENFTSAILGGLKKGIISDSVSASTNIHKLKKLVDALDARMNIVVAVILNGVFLWDINIMNRIEKWRTIHKEDFINWINTIGEFDAFISLGQYSANNPDFVMPEVETGSFVIETENIGHPLIQQKKLVRNNYHIEGLPKVDLLTGANMAGKSTFLRTIGVNLTLAMIGVPVCATKFKFSPILLFTSLRTNDSLQENESFFYAELKRLGMLIKDYENGQRVFFLLDEILKGTNSKDQHTGSEELIKKIIKLNGAGIVATHDVELSKLSDAFPQNVRNLCFEITIENDKLNFDYKIKDGVCRTMNASFLMKRMGITD